MTMAAWSKERQMSRFTLHNWIEEYRRNTKAGKRSGEWMELTINTEADSILSIKDEAQERATPTYTPIRVSIGKVQIEVTTAFDENALAAVIKAVKCQC